MATPLNAERRRQARELFEAAVELPRTERAGFVEARAGIDEGVRAEVMGLFAALEEHGEGEAEGVGGEGASAVEPRPTAAGGAGGAGWSKESPPRRVGAYRLLERIGEGGFGEVFLAEQERPVRRRVALKVLKVGMDTRRVIARFEQERQALALMDHPHIARVLDAGSTEDGRPYFAMELVRGEPITAFCTRHRLGLRERLELFRGVCEAVQHAHQKGIIHRDIKPSNVLVALSDVGGGRPVPKVIDFGIAKATGEPLTDKTLFTEHRQLIGTPEYMSPEQAEMTAVDVDTRTDVYALGVLLYELLTGTTPLDAGTLRRAAFGEMLRQIREVEPPRPSTRAQTLARTGGKGAVPGPRDEARGAGGVGSALLKGELDWIAMKAIEKDRTRRYDSAGALAADVTRFLTGRAVEAGPPGAVYRVKALVRRNRVAVLAGSAVAGALLLGTVAAVVGLIEAQGERDNALKSRGAEADARAAAQRDREEAERARALAESRRAQAEGRLYQAALSAAAGSLQGGNGAAALTNLRSIAPERRGWEWRVLNGLADRTVARVALREGEEAWTAWPTDDPGVALAALSNRPLEAGVPGSAGGGGAGVLFSVRTGEVLRRFETPVVAVTRDASLVAQVLGGEAGGAMVVVDARTGAELWRVADPDGEGPGRWQVTPASFSLDGGELVASDGLGNLVAFGARGGERLETMRPEPPVLVVFGVARIGDHGPADRVLYSAGASSTFAYDRVAKRTIADFRFGFNFLASRAHTSDSGGVTRLRYGEGEFYPSTRLAGLIVSSDISPDERMVAVADTFGQVALAPMPVPGGGGGAMAASAGLKGAGLGGAGLVATRHFPLTESRPRQVTFGGDGRVILAVTRAGAVTVTPTDAWAAEFAVAATHRGSGAVSPDGSMTVHMHWGGATVYDAELGLPLWSRSVSSSMVVEAAWSEGAGLGTCVGALSGAGEGVAKGAAGGVVMLITSPRTDNRAPSEVYVLEGATGRPVALLGASSVEEDPVFGRTTPAWSGDVRSGFFAEGNGRVVLGYGDGSVRVVETRTWSALESPRVEGAIPASAVVWMPLRLVPSPDRGVFAQVSPRGGGRTELLLRETATLGLIRRFELAERDQPTAAAFSPDGKTVYAGLADGSVVAFGVETGARQWAAAPSAPAVGAMVASPDGARLVVFADAAFAVVLDAADGSHLVSIPVAEGTVTSAAFCAGGGTLGAGTGGGGVGALVSVASGTAVQRLEPSSAWVPVSEATARRWPAGLAVPATLLEARAQVKGASELVARHSAHGRGVRVARREIAAAGAVPAVRDLALWMVERHGLALRPNNSKVLEVVQLTIATPAELEGALQLAEELTERYPNDAAAMANRGALCFRLGRHAEAVRVLGRSKAIRKERGLEPYVRDVWMLALAHHALGDKEAARAALAEAEALTAKAPGSADPTTRGLSERARREVGGGGQGGGK